jgi:hypothetical protein
MFRQLVETKLITLLPIQEFTFRSLDKALTVDGFGKSPARSYTLTPPLAVLTVKLNPKYPLGEFHKGSITLLTGNGIIILTMPAFRALDKDSHD